MDTMKQHNFIPPGQEKKRCIESKTPFEIKRCRKKRERGSPCALFRNYTDRKMITFRQRRIKEAKG